MDMKQTEVLKQPVEDQSPTNKRVALLVLGMHRSGTSALTRVLNLLGCSLPGTLMEANSTNAAGHWESEAIRQFNDELLETAGSDWNDWQRLNPGWQESPIQADFKRKATEVLHSEFGNSPFFVLKDPRICRFAPFWLDVLHKEQIEPRIIIPVRNPMDVAASLKARDGISLSVGYLIWLRHILDAERGTRGARRVFTTYNALMDDWTAVAAHIAENLDFRWPRYSDRVVNEIDAFLDRDLQHHKLMPPNALPGSAAVPPWVYQAYEIILRWTQQSETPADWAALDTIASRLDEAGTMFGKPMILLKDTEARTKDMQARFEALSHTETRLHEVEGQLEALQQELQTSLDKAAQTEQALQERSEECNSALARAGEIDSALLQRKEELRQVWLELEAARSEVSALNMTLSKRNTELEKAKAEHEAELQKAKAELDSELEKANKEYAQIKEQLKSATAELDKAQRLAKTAISQRSQTSQEMATITQFLRDSEQEAERNSNDLQWCRTIYATILHRPWWWGFLPRKIQYKKLLQRAERKGLFDAESYLANNPDVAATGMDPLKHYIMHGMSESRTR